jgi:hypothetical protein
MTDEMRERRIERKKGRKTCRRKEGRKERNVE